MFQHIKKITYFRSGCFLLVLVIFVWCYFFVTQNKNSTDLPNLESLKSLEAGKIMMINGQYEEAVPLLENSVRMATDTKIKGVAELSLGRSYLNMKNSTSKIKGADILKRVSLTTEYASSTRSLAIDLLISNYISTKDVTFVMSTVFEGNTWGDFMKYKKQNVDGVYMASTEAIEWALSIYPSFSLNYRLASMYADQLYKLKKTTEINNSINNIEEYILDGDKSYNAAIEQNKIFLKKNPSGNAPFSRDAISAGLTLKARALGEMAIIKKDEDLFNKSRNTFEEAITLLEKDTTNKPRNGSDLFIRYHYAVILLRNNPSSNKTNILEVLAPIYLYQKDNLTGFNFFQGFIKTFGADVRFSDQKAYKDLVDLANFDPRFKSLLIDFGWKL